MCNGEMCAVMRLGLETACIISTVSSSSTVQCLELLVRDQRSTVTVKSRLSTVPRWTYTHPGAGTGLSDEEIGVGIYFRFMSVNGLADVVFNFGIRQAVDLWGKRQLEG